MDEHEVKMPKTVLKDLFIILGSALFVTLLVYFTNTDNTLALATYDPTSTWANWARHYFRHPAIIVSILLIIYLLVWPLRTRTPVLRHLAIIWIITLTLAGGVIVHLVAKQVVDRSRPRESVLIDEKRPVNLPFVSNIYGKGKSFPSGHVVMGAMFAVPFFTLRRRKKALAYASLIGGIGFAGLIGYSRMVLGAHFLTDVIWSTAIILATAALCARFIPPHFDLKTRYFLPFLLLLAVGIAAGSKFERDMTHISATDNLALDLPCTDVTLIPGDILKVSINLKGYGGPVDWLTLNEVHKRLYLTKHRSIFHSLSCSAVVQVPEDKAVQVKNTAFVTNTGLFPVQPVQSYSVYYGKSTQNVVDNTP